jgi:hypothetical protein
MKFCAYEQVPGELSQPDTRDIPPFQVETALSLQRMVNEPLSWFWYERGVWADTLIATLNNGIEIMVLDTGRVFISPESKRND